jgi:hypothetical protein
MATEDTIEGVLARLLLDKPTSQDEHSTPHLHQLWMEHLSDVDDRDCVAACKAILVDPEARFPTVGQFREEAQIQGRDRIRRSIPHDVDPEACRTCGGLLFVFVETDVPWTVRPCECNSHQYDLWRAKHYRRGHMCGDCSVSLARANRSRGGGRSRQDRRREPAPPTFEPGRLGDF